ncbi:RNA 2',3'-cyclic phosphodiesterase [Jatrophihabitans sp. DSM 45814]
MSTRMFVAVVPPIEAIEDLADFVEPRQAHDAATSPLRWTPQEHWHLTLAFMPQVADRNVDDFIERLHAAAAKRAAFELQVFGAGAFPNPAMAKVLWGGVRGDLEELRRLSVGARNAAATSGIEVDGAEFRPHLTLARMNSATHLGKWLQVFDTYAGPVWRVDEIELIESHLGEGSRGRARYHTLETIALGSETA